MLHSGRLGNYSGRLGNAELKPLFLLTALLLSANACGDDDDTSSSTGGRGGTSGHGGVSGHGGASTEGGAGAETAGSGGDSGRHNQAGTGNSEGGASVGTGGAESGGERNASGGLESGGSAGAAGGEAQQGGAGQGGVISNAEGGVGGGGGLPQNSAGAAGAGDREAFRPTEIPATPELIETLQAPAGFTVNAFASGLSQARMLETHEGHVYLTRPLPGDVLILPDTNADGVSETPVPAIAGVSYVHGIAFYGGFVYLATVKQVLRAPVNPDGTFGATTVLVDNLPDGGQHPYRTLHVGPDNGLYISVGSQCDACAETNPENATILRTELDGSDRTVFARGLRNTIGFGWHPTTNALWGMDNGSDWRGNELPPEELNAIVKDKNYGWPYCIGKRKVDPVIQDPPGTTKDAYCLLTEPSTLENQAHEAPIAFIFYDGANFPSGYRNSAFVAFHGSWNRLPPTGYKLAHIAFDTNGNPTSIDDFVSGFLVDDGTKTFGRPAGLTVAPDGSLLFSDDSNGMVYRVHYSGS